MTTNDRDTATAAAVLLLRAFVPYTDDVPSLGACYLLNAALHLEGRTPHVRTDTILAAQGEWDEPDCWYCRCGTINGAVDLRCVNCNRRDPAREPETATDDGSLPGGDLVGGAYIDRDPDEWEIDARMAECYGTMPPEPKKGDR